MGVPKFFRYISERYPCLSEALKEYQIPEFDNLYLDMNGIIHICSHPNDSDVQFRITEEEIFKNIFHYVEILFRMIQPQKLFFLAVDGVAPRAKINQQRARRFRSAKEAEIQEAKARAAGVEIPNEKRFDSNCITPGTLFMSKLNKQLRYFITYKISTDNLWRKCKIIFSGSEVPGEGEHKIMDYIRYMKAQPDYDYNTRHCLYGLDADLIMLGLCTHEPHFSLLREEVKFNKKQKRILTPEETKFCLLHLSLLRDYLSHEFSPIKDKLPFPFDIEHIIDDWVLMGFLVGNDFIPHLPNLDIVNGALPILYHAYMEILPTLEGYINESGTLKLDRFEKFMERLSRLDMEQFEEHYCDLKYFEAKLGKPNNENDELDFKSIDDTCENISTKIENKELDASPKSDVELTELGIEPWLKESCVGLDDESDNEMYNIEFTQHKRDYYMNKLEYENVDENVLRSQAEGYVRAIQWNLNYYYNGCCSWSWYYPHHYAPYISDIKDFKNLKLEFELGEPFLPFEQLLAVLPPYSKELLPEAFQTLLTEEQSPIIEYYPEEFKTDLNGKKQDWEAVVLIPFINEKNLLNAMEPYYNKLTEEEQERNKHGPMMIYTYTQEDLGLCQGPEYFLAIRSHAKVTLINREDIYVSPEKLIKGLHPGVKPNLYFPGFPTLKYIPHEAHLEKAGVKVFEQPARGESMILCIPQQEEKYDLKELAVQLLGTTVYVEWPYLKEAQVIGISDCKLKVSLINPQLGYSSENVVEETAGTISVTQWNAQKKSIIETYKKRLGIDIGQIDILILARPLVGSKYIFETQGRITVEKQWQESSVFYAHQVIVRDISTYSINVMLYKTVDEIFTPKSICFMLGHPHYGTMGKVADTKFDPRSGRIKVCMKVTPEPDLSAIRQAHAESRTQYVHGSIAAQRLGISSHLLSRITGSIYVIRSNTDNTQEFVKHNVGLNLKFNKKNEEIPGYTKKENSQWLYSIKAMDLIRDYMIKYPVLFERLAQNISNDIFNEDELLDKESGELDSIVSWLKEQHFRTVESRACGTNVVDIDVVRNIEKELDKFLQAQECTIKPAVIRLQVKPHLLFKPELHLRRIPPDPKSHNRLLDRIICTRGSFTVPIGYKGIIIRIQAAETLADTMYDIVFDKPFLGGLSISGCSQGRGYRLSITDFINISHGERIERGKPGSENVFPGSVRLQNVKNQQHGNVSAFASFSKMNNQPKILSRSPQMQLKKNIDEISHNATVQLPDTSRQRRCQQNISETRKDASSFRSAAPEADQLTKQLPSEFQQLWNELHKIEDPNRFLKTSVPLKHDQNSKVSSQRNERSSQDPSAFLKEVLKISDNNTQTKASTKSKDAPIKKAQSEVSDAPPLVQKLFDYARQRKGEVQEDRGPIWYCSQLLNHYQVLGMGLPRYDYYLNEQTNLIHAQILLPDAKIFVGDPCTTHAHAAESAAKKVCEQLHLDKTQKPGIKLSMKPQYGKTSAVNNFQYSRQKKSEIKDDKNPIWYCSQLLNYYQLRGIGLPRYDYFINEQTNLIRAQVLLPDAKIFVGDPCVTHAHAAESAAKKVYEQLHLDKAQKTDMKLLLKPPPQQWFNTRQNNNWSPNVRPPSMMHMNPPPMDSLPRNLKWNMKSRQNTGFAQAPGQSNQIKPPSLPKAAETKPEIKNSTSFVPLQAQKQSRNVNKQTAKTAVQNSTNNVPSIKQQKKEETFPKPPKVQSSNKPVEKEARVQNNSQSSPKSQKSAKPKRSRVAAKFISPPTMNGSEPQ